MLLFSEDVNVGDVRPVANQSYQNNEGAEEGQNPQYDGPLGHSAATAVPHDHCVPGLRLNLKGNFFTIKIYLYYFHIVKGKEEY